MTLCLIKGASTLIATQDRLYRTMRTIQ